MSESGRPLLPKRGGDEKQHERGTRIQWPPEPFDGRGRQERTGMQGEISQGAASGPLSSTWQSAEVPKRMRRRRTTQPTSMPRHERLENTADRFRRIKPNGPLASGLQLQTISSQDETNAVKAAFGGIQRAPNQAEWDREPRADHVGAERNLSSADARPAGDGSASIASPFRRIEPKVSTQGISFQDETRALKQAYGVAQWKSSFQDETRAVAEAYGNGNAELPPPAGAGAGSGGKSMQVPLSFTVLKPLKGAAAKATRGVSPLGRPMMRMRLETRLREASYYTPRPLRPKEMVLGKDGGSLGGPAAQSGPPADVEAERVVVAPRRRATMRPRAYDEGRAFARAGSVEGAGPRAPPGNSAAVRLQPIQPRAEVDGRDGLDSTRPGMCSWAEGSAVEVGKHSKPVETQEAARRTVRRKRARRRDENESPRKRARTNARKARTMGEQADDLASVMRCLENHYALKERLSNEQTWCLPVPHERKVSTSRAFYQAFHDRSTLPIQTCTVCYRKRTEKELRNMAWEEWEPRRPLGQGRSPFACLRCFPEGVSLAVCGECARHLARSSLSPAAQLHSRLGCEHMFPKELKGLSPIEEKLIALNSCYGLFTRYSVSTGQR
ncbi:hypothetical protein HIM_04638 [Hirsutella minnesotensis 3608]|uniref:Uncharacterized protein n=1 Tax=Hirsutella minnesotensis 3608 TaxID=1043627 RepID=A0A0F8A5S0_9HYPO|nr:hypothetical protein HIM_04638 [Hirsutella minnesotensis 3608]